MWHWLGDLHYPEHGFGSLLIGPWIIAVIITLAIIAILTWFNRISHAMIENVMVLLFVSFVLVWGVGAVEIVFFGY